MGFIRKIGRLVMMGIVPIQENDSVNKDTNTYKSFLQNQPIKENGWDRVKDIFKLDEFGQISIELNSIYQSGFFAFLVGVMYGGITQSREAYINFMENNQATAFKSHLDAKKKLQDEFTINFAKGGFKWGWRIALFTTSFYGMSTIISVYRGKSSLHEYVTAGAVTGAMYKLNMGIKGTTAGCIVGGVLGSLAGAVSLLIMKLTGSSMEDIRYWQYKWKVYRDNEIAKNYKLAQEMETPTPDIMKAHDVKVGTETILDELK